MEKFKNKLNQLFEEAILNIDGDKNKEELINDFNSKVRGYVSEVIGNKSDLDINTLVDKSDRVMNEFEEYLNRII